MKCRNKKGNRKRRNRTGSSQTIRGTLNRGQGIIPGARQVHLNHRRKQTEWLLSLVCANGEADAFPCQIRQDYVQLFFALPRDATYCSKRYTASPYPPPTGSIGAPLSTALRIISTCLGKFQKQSVSMFKAWRLIVTLGCGSIVNQFVLTWGSPNSTCILKQDSEAQSTREKLVL